MICASIQRWKIQKHQQVIVSTYHCLEELLDTFEWAMPFDLTFWGIQFPREISGLKVAEFLRKVNDQVLVVVTTHYEKYVMEGYKDNWVRYLQKPSAIIRY